MFSVIVATGLFLRICCDDRDDVGSAIPSALPLDERSPLLAVLNFTNWSISKAAQKLHWSQMTLYRKMAKYNFHRKENSNIDPVHGEFDRVKGSLRIAGFLRVRRREFKTNNHDFAKPHGENHLSSFLRPNIGKFVSSGRAL